MPKSLRLVAMVALHQGYPARAETLCREALVLAREFGDVLSNAACLTALASVKVAQG